MRSRLILAAPLLLALQFAFVHWAAGEERPPAVPALTQFPQTIGPWRQVSEDATAPLSLNADLTLNRNFQAADNSSAPTNLLVAWFQSQRSGLRQPHSPQVCLPAAGWLPEATRSVSLATEAGVIPVNEYVVAKGSQRAVVLYWFQTPRRVVASEWAAKFWLAPDAVRDHRSDVALVRVVVWVDRDGDQAAASRAANFARDAYPSLRLLLAPPST